MHFQAINLIHLDFLGTRHCLRQCQIAQLVIRQTPDFVLPRVEEMRSLKVADSEVGIPGLYSFRCRQLLVLQQLGLDHEYFDELRLEFDEWQFWFE